MQDEPTTPAPDQMADIDAALSHLGFDSVADLHYWASDDNELNRFDALVQLLAAHRQTALTAARAQVEGENQRLREALEQCRAQFAFYADEHRKADKSEKAATNEWFAQIARQALAAGEHRKDG